MLRAAAALLGLGLLTLAAVLALIGWRSGRAAVGPLLAGAMVALAAILGVDCRQCATGALYVGALVSLPFFVVGWVTLALDPHGLARGAGLPVGLAGLLTCAWAGVLTALVTFGGHCPCAALPWLDAAPPLRAVGTDRLIGPILLLAGALTLLLARHARNRRVAGG
ncbi:hypothetical protein GCM10007036_27790 [Alsobacter metallidurans]|uniref:Uncharacterized protein n=1 Tax=Alsobacter metallidurans TaxID=340221 RepID=A0A917MIU0_9HYPH|nr:hypothetical protein [Alsobacter metallidurans]GGH22640.1 hypothetical protein GCM10007036_27790 [Alsobacter metallidurans]